MDFLNQCSDKQAYTIQKECRDYLGSVGLPYTMVSMLVPAIGTIRKIISKKDASFIIDNFVKKQPKDAVATFYKIIELKKN